MAHLTLNQRYTIEALISVNSCSITEIASIIGVHKSTISRELKRNSKGKTYNPKFANNKYLRNCKREPYKLTSDLTDEISKRLKKKDSPEQISDKLKKQGLFSISHEAIYLWVYEDKKAGGDLYLNLRQSHIKRNKRKASKDKRGMIPNRVSINERPEIVNKKERFGDYEGDTIIGKNHIGAIVTLTERVTKMVLMAKVETREAAEVEKAIIRLLKRSPIPPKTITFDNGKEFTNHERIAKALGCTIYFANPYCSWERGLNENTNGLIRQFIPKKTAFNEVSHQYVRTIENNLNNRPRKTLEFDSPFEFIELNKNKVHCCV